MPIGFFDDPSFRWSPAVGANLAAAEAAHASVVRALVDWASVAPTRPAHPLDGNDPAYHLSDIDALVVTALRYDLQVLLTISGTPRWANGGKSPNHPPTNLNDLTQFAHMLAARYNGSRPGTGVVTLFSVWNEPNLGQYLTPQFRGDKIVSPAEYVKLFMAAYTGIKAGDPNAVVAAGETSNRGPQHIRPAGVGSTPSRRRRSRSWSRRPIRSCRSSPGRRTPSRAIFPLGPTQKVALPERRLLDDDRVRRVDLAEVVQAARADLGHRVRRADQARVRLRRRQLRPTGGRRDARRSSSPQANPYVQMFVWFILRDSNDQTWFSGLEQASGKKKPAYAAFASTAAGIVGQSQTIAPGHPFNVTLAVPFIAWHDPAGSALGLTYVMKQGSSTVAIGQPRVTLARDETVTFQVRFKPVKHQAYTLTVTVEDKHGQSESHVIALIPDST